MILKEIRSRLEELCTPEGAALATRFFKMGEGAYGEKDIFLGVSSPQLRGIAKEYGHLSQQHLIELLASSINEERLLALLIMCSQFQKGNAVTQKALYDLYVDNFSAISNWNLVDASAPIIVGGYLFDKDKEILNQWALSKNLWERRIAIVSTLAFIKKNHYESTLSLALALIDDSQDLIHKATGWMLREVGKKNVQVLEEFLEKYAHRLPRTTLRYAIERFPAEKRTAYLKIKKILNK